MHSKHQPFLSRLLLLNVFFVVCCRVGWSLNRTGLCLFWLISCLPCERKPCQFAASLEPAGLTHALQEPPVAGEEKGRDAWEVPCTKQGDQGAWSRNTESSTHSALLIAVLLHNRKKKSSKPKRVLFYAYYFQTTSLFEDHWFNQNDLIAFGLVLFNKHYAIEFCLPVR